MAKQKKQNMIPEEVIKRFKELNKQAIKGERKTWILTNTAEEFEPFDSFEEKFNQILTSPVFKHIEKKIDEYG